MHKSSVSVSLMARQPLRALESRPLSAARSPPTIGLTLTGARPMRVRRARRERLLCTPLRRFPPTVNWLQLFSA